MYESTSHTSITEKQYLDHVYKQIMILNDQLEDEGILLPNGYEPSTFFPMMFGELKQTETWISKKIVYSKPKQLWP
jgi:hypothetical protein